MGIKTGNPTWVGRPDTSTPITAQALNNIEDALDAGGEGGGSFFKGFGGSGYRAVARENGTVNASNNLYFMRLLDTITITAVSFEVTSSVAGASGSFVMYKPDGPNSASLFMNLDVPLHTNVEGLNINVPDTVIPAGLWIIGMVPTSTSIGVLRSGRRADSSIPQRDINNFGMLANRVSGGPGFVPPATITGLNSGNILAADPFYFYFVTKGV